MALEAGTRFGAYEVVEQIGSGGMGEVWLARDTALNRDVAVKVLPQAFVEDADRLARFQREAEILASLNHANIATIYGLEKIGDQIVIVMELVEGPTLAEKIAQGPIPVDEAMGIALQIVAALEAAHDKQIVHRDLKPANVKVKADGTVKVLDFGISKPMDATAISGAAVATTPAVTQTGVILGTAAYMSPEQAQGKFVDQRTDIWAFGCLLFEMLTGQSAFAGDNVMAILARVIDRDTDLGSMPQGIAPAVRQTIRLCLKKDLRKRLHHFGDVRLGLEGALETETRTETASEPAAPARRRVPAFALTAVLAVLVTSLVAWNLWPEPATPRVSRFVQELPPGTGFRRSGRSHITLASDGSAIVYNTGSGLLLRRMADVEPEIIPGTEPDLVNPFFSPDSREVAYWDAVGDLFRVAIDGGSPPVRVASGISNPYGASWSADNTILLGQEEGIVRVSADGGTPDLLIEAEPGQILYGPRLLPDGDSVLFGISSTDDPVDGQIVVESLATGDRKLLVESGNEARYVDSGHLIFARGDVLLGVPFDLEALAVNGSPFPLVSNVMRAIAGQTGVAQYGVADNGTLVYVSGAVSAAESSVVWVDREGREETLDIPPGSYDYVRASPDGTRLILDDGITTIGIDVWNFSTEILTRLAFDGGGTGFPIWTPDSNRIVFSEVGATFSIGSKAANNTGSVERLASEWVNDVAIPYFFTPAGDRLVFSITDEGTNGEDIGQLAIGGDGETEWLVQEPGDELNAELSPNGRWMAYQTNGSSGRPEIYVRPFPDVEGDRIQVSNTGGWMPLWSRTGDELFYLVSSELGTEDRMMVVTVDATEDTFSFSDRRVVLDPWIYVGTFSATQRTYDISEDGQRFLAIRNAAIADLAEESVIVLNWVEELKRLVPTD